MQPPAFVGERGLTEEAAGFTVDLGWEEAVELSCSIEALLLPGKAEDA